MADSEVKPRKLTSFEILDNLDRLRIALWPQWMKERMLVRFYNSGPLPADEEECGDDAPVSLGLGYRFIKRPLEQLLDAILTKPGFIKTEVCYPLETRRQFKVSRAADDELNRICHSRMISVLTSLCGRAMITGRGFLFRLSRWDWQFKSGRLLCPPDAPDDVEDSGFREWGFTGKMTLRELDERLDSTREKQGFFGWNHSALMSLKRYIIQTTFAEKTATRQWIWDRAEEPFPMARLTDPLEVYWYFRKSGKRNDLGQETIDLYCVSRWGQTTGVVSGESGGVTYKALDIQSPPEGNEVIYYLPDAFENVKECLIPMLLDARIDGEQQMMQVDGVGKIMEPRLLGMEHLTMALLEGIAFAVQPNWSYSSAVDAATIRMFQKAGLNPWDAVPAGMTMLQKQGALQGTGQALQMLQMLGMSAEADAQTGEMSPLGESQAKFKAEAERQLMTLNEGTARRKEKSFISLDEAAYQIVETLTRPFNLWKKGDPAYYDAQQFQQRMLILHKVLPAEYSPERMKATCRRLSGNLDRQQAAIKAVQTIQTFGGQMAPEAIRFFAKEGVRAAYDDAVAEFAIPDEVQPQEDQVTKAHSQNATALVDLAVPIRERGDDPNVHLPIHIAALEARFRLIQQAGSISAFEREGVSALLYHATFDAQAVVPMDRQAKVGQMLQKMATALQSIPLSTGEQGELGLKQQALQLKAQEFGLKVQREQNLVQERGTKNNLNLQKFSLSLAQFLEQQKSNGVTRAAQLLEMMREGVDEPAREAEVATPGSGE